MELGYRTHPEAVAEAVVVPLCSEVRGSMEDRVRFLMAAEAGEWAHPVGLVAWVRWGSQTNSIHLRRGFLL